MNYILLGKKFDSVFSIPESSSNDDVSYSIKIASDGSEVDSGLAVYLVGTIWKVSFTPEALETYIIVLTDSTINSTKEQTFKAVERIGSKNLA